MNLSSRLDSYYRKRESFYLRLVKLYYDAKSGHIGGSLSCFEALLVLHHLLLTEEDRFVLSKGHAAGALYTALWSVGLLSEELLQTFSKDSTTLPGHPSGVGVPGLLFPTGSLGHGPSLSLGLSLALCQRNSDGRVYCLCSDGEWQEGSCWEALNLAVAQKANNLIFIIDQNKLQGFGTTGEIVGCSNLAGRFEAFGASVSQVNGHKPEEILRELQLEHPEKPRVVILETHKGLGLHFEGKLESHYLPLTCEDYELGLEQLKKAIRI